jgi:small redox-active disulfide protein 2
LIKQLHFVILRNIKLFKIQQIMEIKVLGTGCANCKSLEKAVINALAEMDIIANVEKVEDIQKIMAYGIMRTPGLVINDKVVLAGRVPSIKEIKEIIEKSK